MKNNKIIKLTLVLLTFFSIALTIYSFLKVPALEKELMEKKENLVTTEIFVNSYPSNKEINFIADNVIKLSDVSVNTGEYSSYRAEEGFEVLSDSKYWNEDKLEALYRELKLNKHGEEFELLYKVIIYAEPDSIAAGSHQKSYTQLFLNLDFPAFPFEYKIEYSRNMGTITLYDGDTFRNVKDYAHVLSHEYGHHFTNYYIFKDNQFEGSDYERIRNIQDYEVFYDYQLDYDHYLDNHKWYLMEIAAEDYVQLMGSPMTKNVARYYDVMQRLYNPNYSYPSDSYNGSIQANMLIPFANEVDGLEDYFYQFLSLSTDKTIYEKKNVTLSISSGSSYHESINGPLNFTHYKIYWNDVYRNEGAIYTLICIDEENDMTYAVKTVYPNDATHAYIGTVSYENSSTIRWNYDNIDQGTKIFVLSILLPDGTIYQSQPLEYRFN